VILKLINIAMKKILYLLIFLTLGIISCSKDNDVTEDVPLASNDEYFVHYEFPTIWV